MKKIFCWFFVLTLTTFNMQMPIFAATDDDYVPSGSVLIDEHSKTDESYVISMGDGEDLYYGTRRIVNVSDPVNLQDAATKNYVKNVIEALPIPEIVQTTGHSIHSIMSQKAVTDAISEALNNKSGTKNVTETVTKSVTEDVTTKRVNEDTTESITKSVTEAVTKNVTDTLTKSLTESVTKNLTEIVKQKILDSVYPMGSIYMGTNTENPKTIFGGDWQAWGSGRVPVGVDLKDNDFSISEKTGGSKLLQSHSHQISVDYSENTVHNHIRRTHTISEGSSNGRKGNYFSNVQPEGSGDSQNLQPYICCHMWKRVA